MIRSHTSALLLGVLVFLVSGLAVMVGAHLTRDCKLSAALPRWAGTPLCAQDTRGSETLVEKSEEVHVRRDSRRMRSPATNVVEGAVAADSSAVLLSGLEQRMRAPVIVPAPSNPRSDSVQLRQIKESTPSLISPADPPELSRVHALQLEVPRPQ